MQVQLVVGGRSKVIQCIAVGVVWSFGGGCERGEQAGAGVDVERVEGEAVGRGPWAEVTWWKYLAVYASPPRSSPHRSSLGEQMQPPCACRTRLRTLAATTQRPRALSSISPARPGAGAGDNCLG
jgi:hypothetical protein